MRERKVTALYCDHCNKRGFQRPAMAKHEKRCTRNIGRECGMCRFMAEEDGENEHGQPYHSSKTLLELITILGDGKEEEVAQMRKAAGNCPACVMAAVNFHNRRISSALDLPEFHTMHWVDFDWKHEKSAWNLVAADIFRLRNEEYYEMVGGGF